MQSRDAESRDGAWVREPPPGELGRPLVGTAARRAAGGSLPSAFTGRRHRAGSAANGLCHSHVRIPPNAGIPAQKAPPRNWGSFPPPASGGLCRPPPGELARGRRSLAAVTTLHLRRSASAPTHARRGEPTGPIMNISPGGGSSGDPSRPNSHGVASRRSSLRFGRNTPGIPPSHASSPGRLATLGAHATLPTGCYGPAVRSEVR